MKSSPHWPLRWIKKASKIRSNACAGADDEVFKLTTDCRLRLLLLLLLGRLYWLPAAQLPAAVNRHSQIND